jgi:hypothetical protein
LEYDRSAAQRTTVIGACLAERETGGRIDLRRLTWRPASLSDDQADYYSAEGNQWLSPAERTAARKRADEVRVSLCCCVGVSLVHSRHCFRVVVSCPAPDADSPLRSASAERRPVEPSP